MDERIRQYLKKINTDEISAPRRYVEILSDVIEYVMAEGGYEISMPPKDIAELHVLMSNLIKHLKSQE